MLSLKSTIEDLLERNSSGSGPEIKDYGCGNALHCPQKLVLTSPTSSGRSVGIVRTRTKAFVCLFVLCL
jgi:hypothetical protein